MHHKICDNVNIHVRDKERWKNMTVYLGQNCECNNVYCRRLFWTDLSDSRSINVANLDGSHAEKLFPRQGNESIVTASSGTYIQ